MLKDEPLTKVLSKMKVKQFYIVKRYMTQELEIHSGPYNVYKEAVRNLTSNFYRESEKEDYLIMAREIDLNHICS